MPEEKLDLHITINPLTFLEASEGWVFGKEGDAPSAEAILRFLCRSRGSFDTKEIVDRYKQLTGDQHSSLAILPAEQKLIEKIIKPLHGAISSYMTGNYIGTIALCGAVCEMSSIFSFELAQPRLKQGPLSQADQRKLFSDTFEKLGQHRRIDVLIAMRIVDEETAQLYRVPLSIRKKYLHYFSASHDQIAIDAKKAWDATRNLVVKTLNIRVKEGKLVVGPELVEYLRNSSAGEY
jgi:hypothetical protein